MSTTLCKMQYAILMLVTHYHDIDSINTLGEGMNPIILLPAMGK